MKVRLPVISNLEWQVIPVQRGLLNSFVVTQRLARRTITQLPAEAFLPEKVDVFSLLWESCGCDGPVW